MRNFLTARVTFVVRREGETRKIYALLIADQEFKNG